MAGFPPIYAVCSVHPDRNSFSRLLTAHTSLHSAPTFCLPRKLKRQMRAALHNLKLGKPLKEGETLARLTGYAAYINMSDPALGAKMLATLNSFVPVPSADGEKT